MSNLFARLPLTLFRPLAAQGAPVYAAILLAAWAESQRRYTDLLTREWLMACIYDQLNNPEALTTTIEAEPEESHTDSASTDLLARRAAGILRYLEKAGWLKAETQSDFGVRFYLPDYAATVLQALTTIAQDDPPPLTGLTFSIHTLLQNTLDHPEIAYESLPQARRHTDELLRGLSQLRDNIGEHLSRVVQHEHGREVLRQLLVNYREEIVDRAYHQFHTNEHVARFRRSVQEACWQLEAQPETLAQAAHRLWQRRDYPSVAEAEADLRQTLREIRQKFDALDPLLETIEDRHSRFVASAVRAVQLHLAAQTTLSGQLNRLLEILLHLPADQFARSAPDLLRLNELEFTTDNSLYRPSHAAPFEAQEVLPPPPLTAEEQAEAQARTEDLLRRTLSRQRTRQLAEHLLKDRAECRASEAPLNTPEDLPLLMYLRFYGDGSLGYQTEELPERPRVERAGFAFYDFTLKRSHESA